MLVGLAKKGEGAEARRYRVQQGAEGIGGGLFDPGNNKALASLRGLCFVWAPGVEKRNIFHIYQ